MIHLGHVFLKLLGYVSWTNQLRLRHLQARFRGRTGCLKVLEAEPFNKTRKQQPSAWKPQWLDTRAYDLGRVLMRSLCRSHQCKRGQGDMGVGLAT